MERPSDLPVCLEYHPNCALRSANGYYPNLTETQVEVYKKLKAKLEAEGLHSIDSPESCLRLLRFLRARKFNLEKSFMMLKNDIIHRAKPDYLNCLNETIDECIANDYSKLLPHFKCYVQGADRGGTFYLRFNIYHSFQLKLIFIPDDLHLIPF
jgi:hypothetical protein